MPGEENAGGNREAPVLLSSCALGLGGRKWEEWRQAGTLAAGAVERSVWLSGWQSISVCRFFLLLPLSVVSE